MANTTTGTLRSPDAVASINQIDGIRIGGFRAHHIVDVERWRRGHERAMANHMARALAPGMTVVDVGAYLGYFTLLAADRVGPHGRVHAFEPHPESVRALRDNVRANGFEDRVTVVPAALDDSAAIRSLSLEENPTQSGLGGEDERGRSADVACTTLDRYLGDRGAPDFVKVDVEGAEVAVLDGMASMLERVHDGFAMVIEFNPAALRRAGVGPEDLIARIDAANLPIRVINERTGRLEAPSAGNLRARSWVNLWLGADPDRSAD